MNIDKDKNILITGMNIKNDELQDILTTEFDIADKHNRKFIETHKVTDYEVMTDNGFQPIYAIGKTIEYDVWILKTTNHELKGADEHLVFDEHFFTKYLKDLKVGDKIQTEDGLENVISCINTHIKKNMYDLELKYDSDRRYYTNGILSHNSMWMQNITVNVANQGKNVLFVTLEMGSQKCIKRMGSMRLKIPIKDYDEKAKDTIFMKNKLNSLKTAHGGMFKSKPGKIFVKKFNTGSLTVTELDNFITKLEERKKIKLDMVVVDYLNIMGLEKGLDFANMLFLKGKHLAEGLRRIADKHKIALITATQTDKDVWDGNDLSLRNIPESKAIAETADSVWGIIRNPKMKKNNLYRLKILKLRDGEHSGEQIKFDFNTTYLNIENDEFYDTV